MHPPPSPNNDNSISVQETNDHSILSKHAMIASGYCDDAYLHIFTKQKAPRRAPLINRGYYIRAKAVDTVLHSFVDNYSGTKKQIISVGAGFDTSFFRLSESDTKSMEDVYYIEIDFPPLTERKKKLILNSQQCLKLLGDSSRAFDVSETDASVKISTDCYCLLGQDLSDLNGLQTTLDNVLELDSLLPTLVLSECVMTYMNPIDSTNLIKFVRQYFSKPVFVTYEQVKPHDAFGRFMRAHFTKLNSPLKAIAEYNNEERQKTRYVDSGYVQTDVFTMRDFYSSLPECERQRISRLENFDEYEEYHLKCDHYVLVLARPDDTYAEIEKLVSDTKGYKDASTIAYDYLSELPGRAIGSGAEQYGHASALITQHDQKLLITHGGFGVRSSGQHGRQNVLRVYSFDESGETGQTSIHDLPCRLHHTLTALSDGSVFVFGGRLSPSKPMSDPVILKLSEGGGHVDVSKLQDGTSPEARWRHAATSFRSDGVDYILVTGGLTNRGSEKNSTVLSSCHLYNTSTYMWSDIGDNLEGGLHSHALCYDGDRYVYSVGGLTIDEHVLSDIFRLDTHELSTGWSKLSHSLDPVYSHTCHIFDNNILIVGGIGQTGQEMGAQIINLQHGQVTKFQLPVEVNGKLRMYFNHTSHLVRQNASQNRLVVVGGGGNCFSFGTHINQDILEFMVT